MRTLLIIFLISLIIIPARAQTKKIAFKSHSGRSENLSIALENDLFGTDGNFGQGPVEQIKEAQLDSVIFVSDSVAIMVTSEYCRRFNSSRDQISLWKAGKSKVYNHPLFSRNHSLDSIKSVIKEHYYFRNPVEKVVFVGYDNERKKDGPTYFTTGLAIPGDDDQDPFGPEFVMILSLIVGVSLLGAWVSWKYAVVRANKRVVAAR